MKKSQWSGLAAGAMLAFAAVIGSQAEASRKAEELIGTVTEHPVGNLIVVDGVSYSVVPSPQLRNKLFTLKKGDQVELLMNGSPFDKNSKVIDFILLSRQGA
ncbi:MAG TPA: hypothetical protein VFA75_11660 [Nevskia sp.]|nr:hypothetical protein [Nevskia sp.]